MKKQLIAMVSVSAVVLSNVAPLVVSAADLPVAGEPVKTEGHIKFEVDENPPETVDPGVPPTKPVDPPMNGPLRFTLLPTFEFGDNNKISSTEQNYYAEYQKAVSAEAGSEGTEINIPQKLVTEDVRGGTKGWTVNVKHDGVFKMIENADGQSIPEAELTNDDMFTGFLTLYNGKVTSGNGFVGDRLPTIDAALIKEDAAELSSGLTITSNVGGVSDDKLVMNADKDAKQGAGKHSLEFGTVADSTNGLGFDGNMSKAEVDSIIADPSNDYTSLEDILAETDASKQLFDGTKLGRNRAVKLTIPVERQNVNEKAKYETTIVWTISAGE